MAWSSSIFSLLTSSDGNDIWSSATTTISSFLQCGWWWVRVGARRLQRCSNNNQTITMSLHNTLPGFYGSQYSYQLLEDCAEEESIEYRYFRFCSTFSFLTAAQQVPKEPCLEPPPTGPTDQQVIVESIATAGTSLTMTDNSNMDRHQQQQHEVTLQTTVSLEQREEKMASARTTSLEAYEATSSSLPAQPNSSSDCLGNMSQWKSYSLQMTLSSSPTSVPASLLGWCMLLIVLVAYVAKRKFRHTTTTTSFSWSACLIRDSDSDDNGKDWQLPLTVNNNKHEYSPVSLQRPYHYHRQLSPVTDFPSTKYDPVNYDKPDLDETEEESLSEDNDELDSLEEALFLNARQANGLEAYHGSVGSL